MYIPSGELVIILKDNKIFITVCKLFKSLNFRLFVTFFVLGWIPALIVSNVFLNAYYERAIAVRTTDVQNQCKIISNQIVSSDYLNSNTSDTILGELSLISSLYDGRILIIDQDLKVITDTYNLEASKTMIVEEVISCFKTGTSVHVVSGRFIEVAVPIQRVIDETAGTTETLGVILVSASLDAITDNREVLQDSVGLILTIALVMILLLAVVLSNMFVHPFRRLTKKINAVTAEHIEDDIVEKSYTETEQIAGAFNQLLGKIKILDESRQEFVSNVSHELKTPLTSMKVLADSLVQMPDVPVEYYREFMEDISAEIDRENAIIADLLTMVKLDKTQAEMNIQPHNINELLDKVIFDNKPAAIIVIDEATDELYNVMAQLTMSTEVIEAQTYVCGDKKLHRFSPFKDEVITDLSSDIEADELDTIVVPAREDGFNEEFVKNNRWFAIRISSTMLDKIKYVAAYQVAPVSGITHLAEVDRIEKYKVFFKYGTTKKISKISLGKKKGMAPQSPRYSSYKTIVTAKTLDDLWD